MKIIKCAVLIVSLMIAPVALAQTSPATLTAESTYWQSIDKENDADLYRDYLAKVAAGTFPGTFSVIAEKKLKALGGSPAPSAPAAKPASSSLTPSDISARCLTGSLPKEPVPQGVPAGVTLISPQEAKCAMDAFPDLLVTVAYIQHQQLPRSVPIPELEGLHPDYKASPKVLATVANLTGGNKTRPILIYGIDRQTGLDFKAVQNLLAAGYTNILWMRWGIDGWKTTGYPLAAMKDIRVPSHITPEDYWVKFAQTASCNLVHDNCQTALDALQKANGDKPITAESTPQVQAHYIDIVSSISRYLEGVGATQEASSNYGVLWRNIVMKTSRETLLNAALVNTYTPFGKNDTLYPSVVIYAIREGRAEDAYLAVKHINGVSNSLFRDFIALPEGSPKQDELRRLNEKASGTEFSAYRLVYEPDAWAKAILDAPVAPADAKFRALLVSEVVDRRILRRLVDLQVDPELTDVKVVNNYREFAKLKKWEAEQVERFGGGPVAVQSWRMAYYFSCTAMQLQVEDTTLYSRATSAERYLKADTESCQTIRAKADVNRATDGTFEANGRYDIKVGMAAASKFFDDLQATAFGTTAKP